MKTSIRRLDSLTHNDTAATKLINDNFSALQQGIEDSLSRTGKTPNFMNSDLDLNTNRIINVGSPLSDSDLANKKYVDDIVAAEETRATGVESTLSGRIDGINNTLSTFGNIVTHDTDEFATASQGAKADTAVQPSDLSTVATTGDYEDLINKPVIPVVNDSTVTLTQGGSVMGSFTLNQAGDATIALNGESGGATWGLITGDLSNQTDLQTALSGKQDTISDLATIRSGASAGATAVQPADIANMQTTTNLVTSVSSASTDSQYPSAKLFYDTVGDIETLINAL